MIGEDIEIGEILAGKYRVERIVGRGMMGVVLAATQLGLDRTVAIKLMSAGGAASRENGERFLREARVASMLKSPHAAKLLDVGELASGDPYIVMEFLDGQDLAALAKERGPLPVDAALSFVLQACEAIAEAHFMGIVHRDLKPANLFLTTGPGGSPCVKVLDFGVSKLGTSDLELTKTGQMLGSPLYMAPEQFNSSKDVDARGDLWALGVILYELLAGVPPYNAATVLDLCRMLSTEPPAPLDQHRPDIPAGLCAVIMQCLEKDRERRWPSVAAFAAALAPFVPESAAPYIARIARAQQMDVKAERTTAQLRSSFITRIHASAFDPPDVAGTAFPLVATSAPASAAAASVRGRSGRASVVLSVVLLAGTALTLLLGIHANKVQPAPGSASSSGALFVPTVLMPPAEPAPASAGAEPPTSAVAEQAPAPAAISASAPPKPPPTGSSRLPSWARGPRNTQPMRKP